MRTTTRRTVGALLATALAVGLSACNSGAEPDGVENAGAAGNGSAFPVTVEHEFGETTITSSPERVVSIGWGDLDRILALDVIPVGYYSGFADGELPPWSAELVGDAEPIDLGDTTELDFEEIAALDPDLIIAVNGTGVDEESFQILDAIAPTVARPAGTGGWSVPLAEGTRQVSTALGNPEAGETLLEDLQRKQESVREANPELEGNRGAAVITYDGSSYYVFRPQDGRGAFLESIGLVLPEQVNAPELGTKLSLELSPEQVDILDGDVVLFMADDPDYDPVADNPLFERFDATLLPVAGLDREAISLGTPASLSYALDSLVPRIAEAVQN